MLGVSLFLADDPLGWSGCLDADSANRLLNLFARREPGMVRMKRPGDEVVFRLEDLRWLRFYSDAPTTGAAPYSCHFEK